MKMTALVITGVCMCTIHAHAQYDALVRTMMTAQASNIVKVRCNVDKDERAQYEAYHFVTQELQRLYKMRVQFSSGLVHTPYMQTETVVDTAVVLSGYYCITIDPVFSYTHLSGWHCRFAHDYIQRGDGRGIAIKIPPDRAEQVIADMSDGVSRDIHGTALSELPRTWSLVPRSRIQAVYDTELSVHELYEKIAHLLQAHTISCEAMGMIEDAHGRLRVAIIQKMGHGDIMYAIFGMWEDEEKAKKYGCGHNERIYLSKKTPLPLNAAYGDQPWQRLALNYEQVKNIDATQWFNEAFGLNEINQQRYGKYVFREAVVHENKELLLDKLAWAPFKLNSKELKGYIEYDDFGMPLPYRVVDGVAYYIPPPPGAENTTNPPGYNDLPDMDFYWALFLMGLDKKANPQQRQVTAGMFNDLEDYLEATQAQKKWDGTVYDLEGGMTNQYAAADNQPTEPYVYNKECQLISKPDIPTQRYDPYDEDTYMYLWGRNTGAAYAAYWAFQNITFGTVETGRHFSYTKKYLKGGGGELAPQTSLSRTLQTIQNHIWPLVQNHPERLPASRYTVDKVTKGMCNDVGELYLSFEFEDGFTRESLNETQWYVANPYHVNKPYASVQDFVMYDQGAPLEVKCLVYSHDLGGWYFPHDNIWKTLRDETHSGDMQRYRKAWYLTFRWPIAYERPSGMIRQLGVMHLDAPILVEEDQLFAAGKIAGKRNHSIYLGSAHDSIEARFAQYDKDSKEYHTDQYDHNERNDKIDKAEAAKQIARKIAVAEGLNASVRLVYALAQYNNEAGHVNKALFELQRRITNNAMVKWTSKAAKEAIFAYVVWCDAMDAIKQARETWKNIQTAWGNMIGTVEDMAAYYRDLDWQDVFTQDLSALVPSQLEYMADAHLTQLENSFHDETDELKNLCLVEETAGSGFFDANVEPLIAMGRTRITEVLVNSGSQMTRQREAAHQQADAQVAAARAWLEENGLNTAVDLKVAKALRSTQNRMKQNDLDLGNDKAQMLAMALQCKEHDTHRTIQYQHYMTQRGQTIEGAMQQCREHHSLFPFIYETYAPHAAEDGWRHITSDDIINAH